MKPGELKALLDEGGLSYKQNSKSFVLTCPRCRKKGKLYIRKTDGRFVCWVCADSDNFSGAPEWVLTELLGMPVDEVRRRLYGSQEGGARVALVLSLRDFFGDDDDIPQTLPPEPIEVQPDPGFRALDTEMGEPGRKYLESRGVPLEVALRYGITYHPAQSRVIFPVISRGKLLGWQGRYILGPEFVDPETGATADVPKALTSLNLKKDQVLMFGDRVTGDHAILCEGPMDALKADLPGGNVATMGKVVSRTQLEILRTSGIRRLYLALDPDAFLESKKVLEAVVDDLEVFDMRPPAGYDDLGDMPFAEVQKLFDAAPRINRAHLFLYLKDHYER